VCSRRATSIGRLLWVRRRRYAETSGLPWLILSAKHGVVEPDQPLAPYDLALKDLAAVDRHRWGHGVIEALLHRFDALNGMTFEMHAGDAYRRAVEPGVFAYGGVIDAPLAGYQSARSSLGTRSDSIELSFPTSSRELPDHALKTTLSVQSMPSSWRQSRFGPATGRDS
jgi:hypothetical protein